MVEQIEGYEGLYEIHLIGPNGQPAVWSVRRKRWIKTFLNKEGYLRVTLWKNWKGKTHFIHRLTAVHFINNPDELPCVDHIDGDKTNNRIQNLRWVTHSDNNHNRKNAKGYYWHKRAQKWRAQIQVGGKHTYLGLFEKWEDARAAYLEASEKFFPGIKSAEEAKKELPEISINAEYIQI